MVTFMQTEQPPYRILALDDHPMVLEGITRLLTANSSNAVQSTGSSAELFALIKEGHCFDLFILDLELPDADGFEVLKSIRQHCPDTAILIYTMHEEPWMLARLARLDIQGVVSKGNTVDVITEAVEAIRQGGTWFDEAYLRYLRSHVGPHDELAGGKSATLVLSQRETDVLGCIAQGMTTPEISSQLYISTNTVGTYRRRLMAKFDAHNVAQLISKARRFI